MHWCPDCGTSCYCDYDDTDYGDFIPEKCNHKCTKEYGEDYDEEEDDDFCNNEDE